MYAQAQASSTPPRSSAMTSTAASLLDALKRRNRDPHTSAIARCTSELHSRSTTRTRFHVRCTMSDSVAGTSKCLKRELNVARRAVRAAAETGRGRNRRSRSSKSSYEGKIIERRSWTNFCIRLNPRSDIKKRTYNHPAHSSRATNASSSAQSSASIQNCVISFQ
jgi:hypothetical protein